MKTTLNLGSMVFDFSENYDRFISATCNTQLPENKDLRLVIDYEPQNFM